MSGGRRNNTLRTVTARVMSILSVFSKDHPVLGLSEISRRTGLSSSTTHRLVVELADWGALARTSDLRYRIGPTLRRLGAMRRRGSAGRPLHLLPAAPWCPGPAGGHPRGGRPLGTERDRRRQWPGAALQVLQVAAAVERPPVDAARPTAGVTSLRGARLGVVGPRSPLGSAPATPARWSPSSRPGCRPPSRTTATRRPWQSQTWRPHPERYHNGRRAPHQPQHPGIGARSV